MFFGVVYVSVLRNCLSLGIRFMDGVDCDTYRMQFDIRMFLFVEV